MKRALVTGASGFIGSHIADALIANGDFVIGIDDLSGGDMENLNSAMRHPHEFKFYQVNLENYADTEEVFRAHRPEVILHFAAQAHEGASFYDPYRIVKSNALISSIVFELAAKYQVRKVVYASSMSRYGVGKPPFTETMKPKPVDPYGMSKLASEETLKMLAGLHGFDWTIVVPRNVFGPRQSMRDLYRNFMAIAMNRILRKEPIVIYGKGHVRSFSYIEDSIPAFVKASDFNTCNGEIINIGGIQPVTIVEAATEIMANFAEYDPAPIQELPPRYGEVEIAYCSSEKSVAMLGYKEGVGWKEGVAKMSVWAKEKGPQDFRPYYLPLLNESAPLPWREFAQGQKR